MKDLELLLSFVTLPFLYGAALRRGSRGRLSAEGEPWPPSMLGCESRATPATQLVRPEEVEARQEHSNARPPRNTAATTLSSALVAFALFAPGPQISEPAFAKSVADKVVASGVPGAALAVFKHGKVIYQQAAGLADVERRVAYTTDLAFEIGSLSKQFTASAILMLVAEGKLALETPIGALLSDLPQDWRAATVEQLMHHTSGIPDYEEIVEYDFYNQPRAAADIVRSAAERKPAFQPGDRFEYSNTGYYLLSLIVEQESGLALDRFLATGLRSARDELDLCVRAAVARRNERGTAVATQSAPKA